MKKTAIGVALALLVAGAMWAGFAVFKQLPQPANAIATTRVRRGDIVIRTYARGELRATRSATIVAPNLFGIARVTRLAPVGSFARRGDLIVEFDPTDVKWRLEEKALLIEQLDEQIRKAEADVAIRDDQNQMDLLSAKYAVRRAELDVKRNEFLPAADAHKNLSTLDEAKHRLSQLDNETQARQERAKAELAGLREKRSESVLDANREKERLAHTRLFAPISGLVAIRQNRPSLNLPGMEVPDIRIGDQVNPGVPIAELLDLSELELLARIDESDRPNLREGQSVLIQLDATPGQRINGTIKSMGGPGRGGASSDDPVKKFDVVFALDMNQLFTMLGIKPAQIDRIRAASEANEKSSGDAKNTAKDLDNAKMPRAPKEDQQFEVLLRPGLLADIEITGETLRNALHIPPQAIFNRGGRAVIYVKKGDGFEPRAFTVAQRSESVVVVSKGLDAGDMVALSDPTRGRGAGSGKNK